MESEGGASPLLYCYGIVPRGQALPTCSGGPFEQVASSALVAVAKLVPVADFSAEALERNFEDAAWVAALARRHSTVLQEAIKHGPVVPARLCTLFTNREALRESLVENKPRLEAILGRLRGRQEWGLKLFCDEARLRAATRSRDPGIQVLSKTAAAASAGQGYVLRKKIDARLAETTSERMDAVGEQVLAALAPVALDLRLRPPLGQVATGRNDLMVVNAALLLDVSACEEFQEVVDRLASEFEAEGFALELTGPWPAYSFCELESEAVPADEAESGRREGSES